MRLRLSLVLIALTVTAALLLLPSSAPGDDWNRLTTAVFDHPVRIPGHVLQPGIYVFKLAEISGERNVVQIWNADQTFLHASIMGFPQYVNAEPKEELFIFEQEQKNGPATLKSWFHEGNRTGVRFIYPKD
jgi:hypothetical protein